MADAKLSALTEATSVSGTDEMYLNSSGTSKRTAASTARKYMVLGNVSVVTALPTLTDTVSGTSYVHIGSAQNVTLPTGAQTLAGWWIETEQRNGILTGVATSPDLLLHKDGHTKSAGAKSVQRWLRDHVGMQKITLADATNFAIGGKISGQTNGGKGDIVWKATNDLYVNVTAGSFANGENVDNADPYSAAETTVNGAPTANVNIYSLVGQTAAP